MSAPSRRDVARAYEAMHADSMLGIAPHWERIAGAGVSAGAPGSFVNRAVGVGATSIPTDDELDAIERVFTTRGLTPRFELAIFTDAALLQRLASRGYVLRSTMDLFSRPLTPEDATGPVTTAAGVTVTSLDVTDDAAVSAFVRISMYGFLPEPDAEIPEHDVVAVSNGTRVPGTDVFIASLAGEPVGGGSVTTRAGIAALYGTSVHPKARRRGVHRALIDARLRAGAARGATLATIVGTSGGPTERNALRAGFELGYARFVLERPPR